MAKSKWIILLFTGLVSVLSMATLGVSFATNYWVTSEAISDDDPSLFPNLHVSYGLYKGELQRTYLSLITHHDLEIVCNYGQNKCFYSCQLSNEKRNDEFERLMNGQDLESCEASARAKTTPISEQVTGRSESSSSISMSQSRAAAIYETEFLSSGLWLSVIIFLSMTIAFALISGFLSMLNIWYNPVHFLFGVFGLYIWNGIAAILCFLTMIFWISLFTIFINKNIGITDTLRNTGHFSSDGLANLGFSFWILLVSIVCHLLNIGLVYYRNYLLEKAPKPPVITVNKNDSTTMVY